MYLRSWKCHIFLANMQCMPFILAIEIPTFSFLFESLWIHWLPWIPCHKGPLPAGRPPLPMVWFLLVFCKNKDALAWWCISYQYYQWNWNTAWGQRSPLALLLWEYFFFWWVQLGSSLPLYFLHLLCISRLVYHYGVHQVWQNASPTNNLYINSFFSTIDHRIYNPI